MYLKKTHNKIYYNPPIPTMFVHIIHLNVHTNVKTLTENMHGLNLHIKHFETKINLWKFIVAEYIVKQVSIENAP